MDQADTAVVRLSGPQQERRPVASVDGVDPVCAAAVPGLRQQLAARLQTVLLSAAFERLGRCLGRQPGVALWDSRWRSGNAGSAAAVVFAHFWAATGAVVSDAHLVYGTADGLFDKAMSQQ